MNSTYTVSVPSDLAGWISEMAAKFGKSEEDVIRWQLQEAQLRIKDRPWLALAGCVEGPPDLSMREGFDPR